MIKYKKTEIQFSSIRKNLFRPLTRVRKTVAFRSTANFFTRLSICISADKPILCVSNRTVDLPALRQLTKINCSPIPIKSKKLQRFSERSREEILQSNCTEKKLRTYAKQKKLFEIRVKNAIF